jgi:hypothetical protein
LSLRPRIHVLATSCLTFCHVHPKSKKSSSLHYDHYRLH